TSNLIKDSVPNADRNEIFRKKKFHNVMLNLIETAKKKKVPLEVCREHLIGLGFTVNSFCEGSEEELNFLIRLFVENCAKKYAEKCNKC
ncbi:10182_t:CDS:1, partial [Racocetra fulgida]